MHLLLLLALWTAQADPGRDPGDPAGAIDPLSGPFALVLEVARSQFVDGRHREALTSFEALFERIRGGEPVPEELVVEAMLFRGEVQYKLGDIEASWGCFEWILRRDPDLVMSPYEHHADVVAQFDLVKRSVQLELSMTPVPVPVPVPGRPKIPPMWGWGYVPVLGVPQLAQGQVARGLVYGALQVGFAVTSEAWRVRLKRLNGPRNPFGVPDREVAKVVQRERYLIQWPATILAWGMSGVMFIDGVQSWRRRHSEVSLVIVPDPVGRGLGVVGRF